MSNAISDDEQRRLAAIHDLNLRNTPRDPELDSLVATARDAFDVPVCLISIVDKDVQWFKARCGIDLTGTPREHAFCNQAIHHQLPFLVEDALLDPRFAQLPLVTGPEAIRFYASAPLRTTGGANIGAFCIMDRKPRQLTPDQLTRLQMFASLAVHKMEKAARSKRDFLRHSALVEETHTLSRQNADFELMSSLANIGMWSFDLVTSEVQWSKEVRRIHEVDDNFRPDFESAIAFYPEPARSELQAGLDSCIATRKPWEAELRFVTANGNERWVRVYAAAQVTGSKVKKLYGAFQDVTAATEAKNELALSKQRVEMANADFEMMSGMAKIGVWSFDLKTRELQWSREMRLIHDVDDTYVPTLEKAASFFPGDIGAKMTNGFKQVFRTGEHWEAEMPFISAKGNHLWVRVHGRAHKENGRIVRLTGSVQDVTAATEARNELAISKTRLELATEGAPIGLWDYKLKTDEYWTHPAWWRHLGFAEPVGVRNDADSYDVVHPEDIPTVRANWQAFLDGKMDMLINEFRHRDGQGNWRWVHSTGRITETGPDGKASRISGVYMDVHERMTTHERALYAARHDPMTNLVNREELKRVVVEALQEHQSDNDDFCLVAVDLDRFKFINDNFGHAAGDAVLKEAAERLRRAVRPEDVVARIGGDEFTIVLKGGAKSAKYSASVCNRILAALRAPFEYEGKEHRISASIGIALAPQHGTDFDSLVRNADAALYQVKLNGKNGFCYFDDEIAAKASSRRELETELRYALDRKQLVLHFQPQVDLATRKFKGAEALLRWKHPVRGMIPPDQFIPIAEDTGQIVPIGEWVILESCRVAAQWPEDMTVSVNLSPLQLASNNLYVAVMQALEETGLAPHRLELEVTESVFLNEHDTPLTDLFRLRELGVRLALDDFGTGYASLSYLKKLPFDKIKIDRSFIKDVETNVQSSAIICAVAGLATSLGLETTAEGIETEDQARLAQAAGCRLGQGYLYSRPVPAEVLLSDMSPEPKIRASA